jgi:hypothetical protein
MTIHHSRVVWVVPNTKTLWLDVIHSAHPTPNNFTTHLQQITSKDHVNERWISSFFPFFSPTAVALQ